MTKVLGKELRIPGFFTIHAIFAVLMFLTWTILIVLTMLAFWKGLILFSKEEDVIRDTVGPEALESTRRSDSVDEIQQEKHAASTAAYNHV